MPKGKLVLSCNKSEFGISPGKSCVVYQEMDKDYVVLGGNDWIGQIESPHKVPLAIIFIIIFNGMKIVGKLYGYG